MSDSNRLERLTAILLLLQTKRLIKAQDIAERFSISLRTVYRDVRTLERAGVPILSEPGLGYSLMEGYSLPPIQFSQEEANTLMFGAKLMAPFSDISVKKTYRSALDKIQAVLDTVQNDQLEVLDEHVKVAQAFSGPPNVTENLVKLQQALTGKHVIEIEYFSSYNGQTSSREVELIGLTFYGHHWHLIAWCRKRNAYRDFRNDRISAITFTKAYYKLGDHLGLDEYLQSLSNQNSVQKVVVKIKKKLYPYLVNQKYTLGFISDRNLGDEMEVEFLTESLDFFARHVLMWGSQAKVVSPPELKQMVSFFIDDLVSNYQK